MDAKLNQFASVDDFERALILAQYAHEDDFRAFTGPEFYQFIKARLDLTGLSNTAGLPEEFPEPNTTLEATNAGEWTVLGPGVYNKIGAGTIELSDNEFAFAQFDGSDFNRVLRVKVPLQEGTDILDPQGENIPKEKAVAKYVEPIYKNFVTSKNLLDKSQITFGQFSYGSSTGTGINPSINWIRTPLLHLPSMGINVGDFVTVQGHQSRASNQASVVLYRNEEMIGPIVRLFGDGEKNYTTFQVTDPYLYMGVNIHNSVDIGLNPESSPFYNTIMISKGDDIKEYQEHGRRLNPKIYPTLKQVQENRKNIEAILDKYYVLTSFNGVNSSIDLYDTSILSEDGDYVEFSAKWLGDDYRDGLGIIGTRGGNDNTMGFSSETRFWIRSKVGQPYIEFNDIPNAKESLRVYKVEVTDDCKEYRLYIDGVLFGTSILEESTDFTINNIGQTYESNYFKGILGFVNIKSGGVLKTYPDLISIGDHTNTDTNLEPKDDGGSSTSQPNVFVEFSPDGFNGRGLFIVYTKRIGSNSYVGHHVANDYNMIDAAYKDLYRIMYAHEYIYENGAMVKVQDYTIYEGESEFVIRTEGDRRDHTGGTHGDEIKQNVAFFVDGLKIDDTTALALKPCNEAMYMQTSTLHYTPLMSEPYGNHDVIANHTKKTTFKSGCYYTENKLFGEVEGGLPIRHWYCGICCVGKIQASVVVNENLDTMEMTGTNDSNLLAVEGSREINMYNTQNIKAIHITSSITNNNAMDKDSYVFIWDRPNDSKYYRKSPVFTLEYGEKLESIMLVEYK